MPPKIIHDGTFDIAIGRNRKETNWKNKEIEWSDFVEKLSITHRTAETHAEYTTAKKVRQDEIKDIGGFVGGYLNSGRRKAGNVVHRQLITLDLDYATPAMWDDFTLMYSNAAVLYSTHKHAPDGPRYRLIIPLNRTVFVDEYQAIARKIAGMVGIELFDPTTFQPERLMYWPSTSKDGEYVFEYQDGPWLDADKILNSYFDWRDSSSWPVSAKVDKLVQRSITKQGDPLDKPGVIGAWCRTYGIAEVMELFLADVYDPCTVENRYTYKEGSTAAGLVVYDDKYVFSHHGTDPTSGKLCNAFDIVRLHKFGLRDEDAREGTPNHKMPSYVAMEEFCTKDVKVKKLLGAEKLQHARGEFYDEMQEIEAGELPVEENNDWLGEMDIDRKSNYLTTVKNIQLVLENDPKLKNRIGLNSFSNKLEVLKPMPWDKSKEIRMWTDDDWGCLRCYLGVDPYNFIRTPKLEDVMSIIKKNNHFHPVKEYLKSCKWDGEERIDTLFIDYLGAEDSQYTRAVTRKSLVAAVARVFQPGIKFDTVPTLVGKQGTGKSTIIKKLGREWYSDTFNFNMLHQGKQAFEQIQGVWLVEIGEMVGLKKADVEAAKNFISSGTDLFRPSHAKETVSRKRQCVFFGTTNSDEFLKAANGNRRFWPIRVHTQVPVKNVWRDFTDDEIHQVWAEALKFYKEGESLSLSHELEILAAQVQELHEETDERSGLIEQYLNTLVPENWDEMGLGDRRSFLQGMPFEEPKKQRTSICVAEIWCELLNGFQKDMTPHNTKYIHDILRKIKGWEVQKNRKKCGFYGKQTVYILKDNSKKPTDNRDNKTDSKTNSRVPL